MILMELKSLERKIRQHTEKSSQAKDVNFTFSIEPEKNGYRLIVHKKSNKLFSNEELTAQKYLSKSELKNFSDKDFEKLVDDLVEELEERPDPGPGLWK